MRQRSSRDLTCRLLARTPICTVSLLLLAGCAGLSQMQDSISHLDQAAHTASTAEAAFLTSVQSADCDSQFFTGAYRYSVGKADNFELANYCAPKVITDEEISLRNQMMTALTLYADTMLALATGGDNKQLGTNVETLAANLKTAASDGSIRLPKAGASIVAGVEAAFTAIAQMALDQKKYKSVTDAAAAMQAHVEAIVEALLKENYGLAQSVVASHIVLEGELRAEVAEAPATTAKFEAILHAREVLANSTGATTRQIATKDWNQMDLSRTINNVLPGLGAANNAIAKGAPGGIYAAAHDLYARSQAARDLYSALSK